MTPLHRCTTDILVSYTREEVLERAAADVGKRETPPLHPGVEELKTLLQPGAWCYRASNPGLAASMVAHLSHSPHHGKPGKVRQGRPSQDGPWCSSSSPRGGKTSLTGTRANPGGREEALSPRELPLVQAVGEGRGSASPPPRCHIPHSGKTGCLSLPPHPS